MWISGIRIHFKLRRAILDLRSLQQQKLLRHLYPSDPPLLQVGWLKDLVPGPVFVYHFQPSAADPSVVGKPIMRV